MLRHGLASVRPARSVLSAGPAFARSSGAATGPGAAPNPAPRSATYSIQKATVCFMSPAAGSHAAGSGGPGAGKGDATARAGAAARNAQQAVVRARHAASKARLAADSEAQQGRLVREMFAQPIRDYLYQVLGRPIAVLRAGCQTPIEELGLEKLRASGYEIGITTVDQDSPAARAAASGAAARGDPAGTAPPASAAGTAGTGAILGDLRMISLPPRSFDIVHCAFLLERIPHAALVLDRFVAALRPGGLLLLRVRDRDCAAAALDRITPEPVRRTVWARLHAGEPGPLPAIYDPVTSARGLQAYALSHGLVFVRREAARTVPEPPGRLTGAIGVTRALIAWLSRGRLTDAHDELLYVIRKPEDRFARLV
jgi:SAM-dependent methyltransferase